MHFIEVGGEISAFWTIWMMCVFVCVIFWSTTINVHKQMNHLWHMHLDTVTQKQIIIQTAVHVHIKKIRAIYLLVYRGGQLWSVIVLIKNRNKGTRNNPLKQYIYHCMYNSWRSYVEYVVVLNRRQEGYGPICPSALIMTAIHCT